MKIAVLGGGHGSYAAAADLSDQGHEVRLWGRNEVALAELLGRQTITLKDFRGARDVILSLVTTQIGAAVDQADLIVVPTPAFAQEDIANALAPHLKDGQVIFLPPGTFGSYAIMKTLRAAGCVVDIAIGETGTLPYLARKHGTTQVAVTTRATRLPTGIFPAIRSEYASGIIARAYPSIEVIEDALSGALMNAGPIIHPPLILMNAGPLEHFDRWDIHNEGTQPAIRRVTDVLDGERIAVREALGYQPYHFPLRDHYTTNQWMYGDAHNRLVDSGDWREKIVLTQHRYMLEDIHYGLAFLVSVAEWANVPAPTAKALLSLASAVCGSDLRHGPRTLESLGLAEMSEAEIKHMLRTGVSPA
jgi:opine dehydrogenase